MTRAVSLPVIGVAVPGVMSCTRMVRISENDLDGNPMESIALNGWKTLKLTVAVSSIFNHKKMILVVSPRQHQAQLAC